ncbi:toll/interleukin-1 receptor domain-containing protein [uncultured Porphyromonas sp.]|uniref:toll/interleukin-1 receptor domain-containing protein n=1 Tax=uncultured Porphyromonas sp. TaxID=159274 RepID=UPI002618AC19|nr:toll/interleukin-1 receptor domain-containing protein [uncultured Porphyromonas sp.]
METIEKAPKAFISYSWDNEDHKNWVARLAADLRGHGIDCILDQWDARAGEDLPKFMEQMTASDYVICIISQAYTTKANIGEAGGVQYEKRILSAKLYNEGVKGSIIPILRNNPDRSIPTFLFSIQYIDFCVDEDYEEKYEELCRLLHKASIPKPPLGRNPFADSSSLNDFIDERLSLQKVKYQNHSLRGTVSDFDMTENSGSYRIGVREYQFDTHWSICGNDSAHCYRQGNIRQLGYNRSFDNILRELSSEEILVFDYSSRARTISSGECVLLTNDHGKSALVKLEKVQRPSTNYGHYITFSYIIFDAKV